jgi:small neutral amino acid transporter SnatA (MarC family)
MPRSPAQSDFVIASEPAPVALPDIAQPVVLPTMIIRTTQAGERATRWVLRFVLVSLALLAFTALVLGHIPSGG